MRAISRFPPPDSHVSLSAVLEPGPNARPALPPRPTTAQSNLPHNRGPPHRKPTPTDTPRDHNPPRLRSEPLTSLADKPRHLNHCEFETWYAASKALTRFKHQPTPPIAHDTRPSRSESTQSAMPPAPATCERKPNRLRELFPPQAPASAPTRRSTSKVPNRPGQHLDIGPVGTWSPTPCFSSAVHSANYLFSRCVSIYQLKTLTEQGINEHCIVFLKALTASAKLRGGCGATCHKTQPTECARSAAFHQPIATSA
jgi:hypothetical protein